MSRGRALRGSLAAPLLAALLLTACVHGAQRAERQRGTAQAASPETSGADTARGSAQPATPPAYFDQLAQRARALAEQPARAPAPMPLPPELQALDYDGYRMLRFRPERSLWRGEPGRFEVQFFHPGPGYRDPVFISVLEGAAERPIPFSPDWFSYAGLAHPPAAEGLQFTGLRVHAPLNRADYRDEVIAFHGASYFRALGKGNVYGLSARGLAIDLGTSQPEEFPEFTHFYLLRPGAQDSSLWILSSLESARATGAYAFRIQPGVTTEIDVTARLFLRDAKLALGLAPLSSMYLGGEEAPNRFGDFRPEVHDSDGLALWSSSGERLFRPLRNPKRTVTSSFRLDAPRGFGLLQRDRDFDHYQDLEARYHDRPSLWVEPVAGFATGSVRLLEIAAHAEHGDNIAMAWVPDAVPALPHELALRYRLRIGSDPDGSAPAAGQVQATRVAPTERGLRFLVDFRLPSAPRQADVVLVVSCTGARVLEQHLEENPFARGIRASFEVAPDEAASDLELRAFLRANADTLTETWSYAWQTQ